MRDNYITPDDGIRLCESILRQLEELDLQDQIAGVVLDTHNDSTLPEPVFVDNEVK